MLLPRLLTFTMELFSNAVLAVGLEAAHSIQHLSRLCTLARAWVVRSPVPEVESRLARRTAVGCIAVDRHTAVAEEDTARRDTVAHCCCCCCC